MRWAGAYQHSGGPSRSNGSETRFERDRKLGEKGPRPDGFEGDSRSLLQGAIVVACLVALVSTTGGPGVGTEEEATVEVHQHNEELCRRAVEGAGVPGSFLSVSTSDADVDLRKRLSKPTQGTQEPSAHEQVHPIVRPSVRSGANRPIHNRGAAAWDRAAAAGLGRTSRLWRPEVSRLLFHAVTDDGIRSYLPPFGASWGSRSGKKKRSRMLVISTAQPLGPWST